MESGANTGALLAYSGHASVASLARYTRVSPDALTRWQAAATPQALLITRQVHPN